MIERHSKVFVPVNKADDKNIDKVINIHTGHDENNACYHYGLVEIKENVYVLSEQELKEEKKKEAIALETYLKKINPDKDSTEIYQYGFHDAIEVVLNYLSNNQQK